MKFMRFMGIENLKPHSLIFIWQRDILSPAILAGFCEEQVSLG